MIKTEKLKTTPDNYIDREARLDNIIKNEEFFVEKSNNTPLTIYCLFLNNELFKAFTHKESIDVYIKKYLPSNLKGVKIKRFREVIE